MELSALETIKQYVPVAVIVSVVVVIALTYTFSFLINNFENYLEGKEGKEIHFFDHKKVWLSLFWCVICGVTIAAANFIAWKEVPFYVLVILGGSTLLYESVIKKVVNKNDKQDS